MSTIELTDGIKYQLQETLEKLEEDKTKLEDKLDKTSMKLNGDIIKLTESINALRSLLATAPEEDNG
jgi:sugar-specific transcriptional regulator TrmB